MKHIPKNIKDLEKMVDEMLEFDNLSKEEKDAFSLFNTAEFKSLNQEEIVFHFITYCNHWGTTIMDLIPKEKFRLCAKIHQLILIEKYELKELGKLKKEIINKELSLVLDTVQVDTFDILNDLYGI